MDGVTRALSFFVAITLRCRALEVEYVRERSWLAVFSPCRSLQIGRLSRFAHPCDSVVFYS